MTIKQLLAKRATYGNGIWGAGFGKGYGLTFSQIKNVTLVVTHMRVRSNIIRSQLARMSSNFKHL